MIKSLARSLASAGLGRGLDVLESAGAQLAHTQRVLRYARGLLQFQVRPDDVFISSYPRSGTTWMQFLLYQLTTSGSMDFRHISEVVPWFERSLAVGALTAADLEGVPSPRLFKSHLPYRWLPRGARYIYVARDGRDVAVSYYHFYRSHLRFQGDFEQFFGHFLRGEVQYRSWFKHTAGWRAFQEQPDVLWLDYEELKRDLRSCVRRIASFLAIELDDVRLARVEQRCSFEYMKQHEQQFDFATEFLLQSGYDGSGFLRGGRVGEGKVALSTAQRAAFERAARQPARRPDLELDLPQFLQ